VKSMGAPGLAFETWDPSNQFPLETPTLLFVIRSLPGFPAALLSWATPDVVLFKENHTQPTEAATLDRKSGEVEGSAVPGARSFMDKRK
jgi:hypothetical protein